MDTLATPTSRPISYDAQCRYCARRVFHDARRVGSVQLAMIENHALACRPLDPIDRVDDLLGLFKITETA